MDEIENIRREYVEKQQSERDMDRKYTLLPRLNIGLGKTVNQAEFWKTTIEHITTRAPTLNLLIRFP